MDTRPISCFELTPYQYNKKREKKMIGSGRFVMWGADVIEDENGFSPITIAIVENPDGTVSKFDPEMIQFTDR